MPRQRRRPSALHLRRSDPFSEGGGGCFVIEYALRVPQLAELCRIEQPGLVDLTGICCRGTYDRPNSRLRRTSREAPRERRLRFDYGAFVLIPGGLSPRALATDSARCTMLRVIPSKMRGWSGTKAYQ